MSHWLATSQTKLSEHQNWVSAIFQVLLQPGTDTLRSFLPHPQQRNREEVVNTQLAILVSRLGVTADAETIHVHGKHRPDVLFGLRGLRVVIEAKLADHPNAEQVVLEDARNRVRSGIAHIAAAVVYPVVLRQTPTTKIIGVLQSSQLKYRIVTETQETEEWFEGDPTSLMDALRHAQEALTKDDIVEQTAMALSVRLDGVAKLWLGQAGACDRLSSPCKLSSTSVAFRLIFVYTLVFLFSTYK